MQILCVAGPSGSGKTTLIERIVPLLSLSRHRVALLKHTHHDLTWHPPEKDSGRLWDAGVGAVAVIDPGQGAYFLRRGSPGSAPGELDPRPAWTTLELVSACGRLPGSIELVLAEGWSRAAAPKVWVVADGPGVDADPPMATRAVVTAADRCEDWRAAVELPVLSRDEPSAVAERLAEWTVAVGELPVEGPSG